jgi:hypothetical protein
VKGNDLDNLVVPRDVLVWEGLLGLIPDRKVAMQEQKFRKRKKWEQAVACYTVNELLARKIWQLVWDRASELDLLTYHGIEFARALEERMDGESMPFRRVFSEEPNVYARSLAVQPDVRTVYDPFPDHQFLYGGKGRILAPETAHYMLGAM